MTTTATETEGTEMKISRKRQLVLALALGIVAASVLAVPAQARPDDLDGTLSYTQSTQPLRPDDRATRISPVAGEELVDGWAFAYTADETSTVVPNLPDGRAERATFGGGAEVIPVSVDDGFQIDWRDAALGAVGATALFALMASMALAVRHSRHGRGLATS
jgi:hypothetical protein